jgi:thiol-disulfide isomerase/thioredoxin
MTVPDACPTRRFAGLAIAALPLAAGCTAPTTVAGPASTPIACEAADVLYFYGESCHQCHAVMPFSMELARDHPRVRFDLVEIHENETNASRYREVNRALNVTAEGIPEAVADGRAFFGEAAIRAGLPDAVATIEARR